MLIPENIKVHLYCGITDMRKSINTLAIMVQDVLQMEPQFVPTRENLAADGD